MIKRFLILVLLCLNGPALAGTGDMFGDLGYVPATVWTPPLHDHADMFAQNQGYVGTNAEMFAHVQAPGAFGIEDMFKAHDMGPAPDMMVYHRPDLPY